ncbi:thiol-disulfide oxidoreductase DCC family protein [Paenibacillus sp. NPDC057934]|uniref:thiol-disulfide oxidoreductase DCC family protein n=1 Tax=Paenibacillus sp. NPDC057934 TaxID=3346282 RepID=UPI0036D7968B
MKKKNLTVLYDSWCPLCTRTSKIINKLDVFSLIELVSFRDEKNNYSVPLKLLEKEMYSFNSNNKFYSGYDTLLQIAWRTPLIIIYPILIFVKLVKIGDSLYNYIARNRKIVCDESCQIQRP